MPARPAQIQRCSAQKICWLAPPSYYIEQTQPPESYVEQTQPPEHTTTKLLPRPKVGQATAKVFHQTLQAIYTLPHFGGCCCTPDLLSYSLVHTLLR